MYCILMKINNSTFCYYSSFFFFIEQWFVTVCFMFNYGLDYANHWSRMYLIFFFYTLIIKSSIYFVSILLKQRFVFIIFNYLNVLGCQCLLFYPSLSLIFYFWIDSKNLYFYWILFCQAFIFILENGGGDANKWSPLHPSAKVIN